MRLPSDQRRFSARGVEALLRARAGTAPRCVVYARVSSQMQAKAGNLDRQQERLLAAAKERGYRVVAVVAERASGLNEKRRGLWKLFRLAAAGEIDVVLVEFQDRLARFGFTYITEALSAYGVQVEVLDSPMATDAAQELVQDMLAIVTWTCPDFVDSLALGERHLHQGFALRLPPPLELFRAQVAQG